MADDEVLMVPSGSNRRRMPPIRGLLRIETAAQGRSPYRFAGLDGGSGYGIWKCLPRDDRDLMCIQGRNVVFKHLHPCGRTEALGENDSAWSRVREICQREGHSPDGHGAVPMISLKVDQAEDTRGSSFT
jgi:hypothetical protein